MNNLLFSSNKDILVSNLFEHTPRATLTVLVLVRRRDRCQLSWGAHYRKLLAPDTVSSVFKFIIILLA